MLNPEEVQKYLAAAGVEYESGEQRILDELVGHGKLAVMHLPWTNCDDKLMRDEEIYKLTEDFYKAIFIVEYKNRDALASGAPWFRFRVMDIIEDYPIIKRRVDYIAKLIGGSIVTVGFTFYRHVEKKHQAVNSGGAGPHYDSMLYNAKIRALDTIGTPVTGKDKKMTFKEMKTDESVTITVPHSTVIYMSSECCGNHGEKYKHSVADAHGTGFFVIDTKM